MRSTRGVVGLLTPKLVLEISYVNDGDACPDGSGDQWFRASVLLKECDWPPGGLLIGDGLWGWFGGWATPRVTFQLAPFSVTRSTVCHVFAEAATAARDKCDLHRSMDSQFRKNVQ